MMPIPFRAPEVIPLGVLTYHDVSHYQGNYHPTGATMAKATQGTGNTDPQYATTRARTLASGWPFAAYHYLDTSDVNAQARHAHAVVGSTPLMVDVEQGSGQLTHLVNFIDAYRKLGGLCTLVYLPHWYWQSIGSPSLAPLETRGIGLVSSSYPSRGYSENGPGWQPYGGMTPVIWQYTSTPLDTNAFHGTINDLRTTFEEGPIVPLSDADKTWIKDAIAANNTAITTAVWALDSIPNPAWRSDSPLAKPPGKNPTITTGHALEYALNEAHAAAVAPPVTPAK